ncbi:MAG: recombination mediator RecR [Eubacteriaceae bacterium]|jgi:recombination protein RecR|nr:recombination mediator RecR [Eubacteriaceae bacterium]
MLDPFARLINELSRLPGIGKKTAQRLAYYMVTSDSTLAYDLSDAIRQAKDSAVPCSVCFNISSTDPCEICSSASRDTSIILVVQDAKDLAAIERARTYNGLYHVLGGAISPLSGIKPENLRVSELVSRLQSGVGEVILATSTSIEGETTAVYLARLIEPLGIKATRLARGLPIGAELEYADPSTLLSAIEGRKPV